MKVRKIVAGLAAVSMLAAFSAQAVLAADTVAISAGKTEVAPGDAFTLDISLADVASPGITVAEFAVTYDASVVTVTGVEKGTIIKSSGSENFEGADQFEYDFNTAGVITITYSTATDVISENGVLATVKGTVSADAAAGEYAVQIVPIDRETVQGSGVKNAEIKAGYIAEDGTTTKYAVTGNAGAIVVTGGETTTPTESDTTPTESDTTPTESDTKPTDTTGGDDVKYGDANVDGSVDIMDVIAVNKYLLSVGNLSDQGLINADVDLKDGVTGVDSLNILKAVAKITTLPVVQN